MIDITDEMWTLEYNTSREGCPFHVDYLDKTLEANLRRMMQNEGESPWQVVFIGSHEECHQLAEQFAATLERHGII